jgi:hypothetical protein
MTKTFILTCSAQVSEMVRPASKVTVHLDPQTRLGEKTLGVDKTYVAIVNLDG